jgi:hypothetical protein
MAKIICSECGNQIDGVCRFSKSSVKLNKRRNCDKFKLDESKVKVLPKVPTTRRPAWWHNRKEMKQLYKKRLKEVEVMNNIEVPNDKYITDAHPITGNLEQFMRSTAETE